MREPAIHLFNDPIRDAIITAQYLPRIGDVEISVREGGREPLYILYQPPNEVTHLGIELNRSPVAALASMPCVRTAGARWRRGFCQ